MHACIGEGNGNPPQYSCLENPRDGGAWWVVIYGSLRRCTESDMTEVTWQQQQDVEETWILVQLSDLGQFTLLCFSVD